MVASPNHKLASALNSVSLNSPSTKSLKDVMQKSSKRPSITSITTPAVANNGMTRKRNGSPVKLFNIRDRITANHEDLTRPIMAEGNYRASHSARSSPVKQSSRCEGGGGGGSSKNGLNSAGGGLGRMDVVSNDWDPRDPRSESTKRSPSKKGKNVSRRSLYGRKERHSTKIKQTNSFSTIDISLHDPQVLLDKIILELYLNRVISRILQIFLSHLGSITTNEFYRSSPNLLQPRVSTRLSSLPILDCPTKEAPATALVQRLLLRVEG